jgi:hypothetical protein
MSQMQQMLEPVVRQALGMTMAGLKQVKGNPPTVALS